MEELDVSIYAFGLLSVVLSSAVSAVVSMLIQRHGAREGETLRLTSLIHEQKLQACRELMEAVVRLRLLTQQVIYEAENDIEGGEGALAKSLDDFSCLVARHFVVLPASVSSTVVQLRVELFELLEKVNTDIPESDMTARRTRLATDCDAFFKERIEAFHDQVANALHVDRFSAGFAVILPKSTAATVVGLIRSK